jgi:hypothetical protein
MKMENKLPESALKYIEMGLSIIPLRPGEKIPLIKWEQYQKEPPTKEKVMDWWKKWPKANIGIVTGRVSDLAVIDLDKYAKDYSEDVASQYFPDSIETPCVETPRGGQHLYFTDPGNLTINARALPGIDLRAEGGYVVAPPSVNGTGKAYRWVDGLDIGGTKRSALPSAYINKIISTIYGAVTEKEKDVLQSVTSVTTGYIWEEGKRDENLFHVAHCLTQTRNSEAYIRQTLRAIILSWGETDEGWINAKIESAAKRAERKERNIQAEVDCYIAVTDGAFSVTSCYSLLQAVTKEEKNSVRAALMRRKDKTIERVGPKDGVYRRIDTDVCHIDFAEEQGASSEILLPLGLDEIVNICEGNIILISGEFNAGKTTFALNALQMNKNRMMIRYISSEMKAGEFKSRWRTFGIDESFWMPDEMTQYVELKNNLPALILPDALNIIDYLEFRDGDYTQGAEYMRQIHDKLNKGVAIVCNQQKEGAKLPRSGDLIMEKPRLAVTFRKVNTGDDEIIGIAEIQKAKNVRLGKADGKKLKYEIRDRGSRFKVINNWGWWK